MEKPKKKTTEQFRVLEGSPMDGLESMVDWKGFHIQDKVPFEFRLAKSRSGGDRKDELG